MDRLRDMQPGMKKTSSLICKMVGPLRIGCHKNGSMIVNKVTLILQKIASPGNEIQQGMVRIRPDLRR